MDEDIIVAAATPPGHGALALVRLSGKGCLELVQNFLRSDQDIVPRQAKLIWLYEQAKALDQALITYFPKGHSYTGEQMLEISIHGSPYILERVLKLCQKFGARLARPGEFTQRAFLNGRLDLAQAEGVCDLIAARSRLAHRCAIAQLEGGLSRYVGGIRDNILDLRVLAEASLDHPDEDLPQLSWDSMRISLSALRRQILELAESFSRGQIAKRGARIPIVGRPNTGKSTLLNRLLGIERAIVSDQPGTTRDTIEQPCDLEGLESLLIDTAGLREDAEGPIEQAGIQRTRCALKSADLALLLLDRTQPLQPQASLLQELLTNSSQESCPFIVVLNKIDSQGPWTPHTVATLCPEKVPSIVEISALQGTGIKALMRQIHQELLTVSDPTEDDASPQITSLRHYTALTEAARELQAAEKTLQESPAEELLCAHLHGALTALEILTGRISSENILGEIFSRFCIGK